MVSQCVEFYLKNSVEQNVENVKLIGEKKKMMAINGDQR